MPEEVVWDADTREAFSRLLRAGDTGRRGARDPRPARPSRPFLPVGRRAVPSAARSVPPLHGGRASHEVAPRDGVGARGGGRRRRPGAGRSGRSRSPDPDPLAPRRAAARHRQERGRGARAGRRSGRRIDPRSDGCRAAVRDLVRFMVAQHLLLPDTATRRDLSDENLSSTSPRRSVTRAPGGALPARQGRCGGDRPRRVDAVATDPDPRARGEGPARPRAGRDGHGARGAARRPGRPGPRPPRRRARPEVDRFLLRMPRRVLPVRRARAGGPALRDDRAGLGRRRSVRSTRWAPRRHVRGARRRRRPRGTPVVDRRLARARRHVDPHRAGLHDRGRGRRRPVRGRRRVRPRGARAARGGSSGDAPPRDRRLDLPRTAGGREAPLVPGAQGAGARHGPRRQRRRPTSRP